MNAREITGTEFAALKVASRALVARLGGGEAASLVCRYNGPALSDACSLTKPDRSLPVDVVADLERCAGDPVVTRILAGLSNHALVPLPTPGGQGAQAIARVLAGAADVAAEFAADMTDGRLSSAERQRLKDRLLALNAACVFAAAVLDTKGETGP